MNRSPRVLIVASSEAEEALLLQELQRGDYHPHLQRVDNPAAMAAVLDNGSFEFVLARQGCPHFNALAALEVLKNKRIEIPFVLIADCYSDRECLSALKAGADDFVAKNELSRLVPAIERLMREAEGRRQRDLWSQALHRSEEQLRIFVAHTPAAVAMLDTELRYLLTSRRWLADYGLDDRPIIGRSHYEVFPEIPERWREIHRRCLAGAVERCEEDPFVRADGRVDWVRWEIHPWRRQDGRIGGIIMFTEVITARKQAEDARREAEARFRALVEQSLVGVYMIREDSFVYMNEAGARMFGYAPDEVIGKLGPLQLTHAAERPMVRDNLRRRLGGEGDAAHFTFRGVRKDGSSIHCEVFSRGVQYQGQTVLLGTLVDITTRKRAEEQLQESEERFRRLIELSPDAILVQADGRITFLNSAAMRLLGATEAGQLLGRSVADFVGPARQGILRERLDQVARSDKEAPPMEERVLRLGGTKIDAELRAAPCRFDGKPGVQVIVRDVTERNKAVGQIRESREQLRALATRLQSVREDESVRIAREIHDELGQALTALKMDLAWLTRRLSEPEKPGKQSIVDRVSSMSKLIDSTIQTVRRIATQLRPGVLDSLGLVAALEWQANDFQRRTGMRCELDLPTEPLELDDARSTAIFRIFQETLTNVARHSRATTVHIRLSVDPACLLLEVRDNGKAIEDTELQGTKSLGMLGMRERAAVFGGDVTFLGAPGKGTTVTVRIPRGEAAPIAARAVL